MVVFMLIHVLFKRMVNHSSSKYGWHIYNRCFHDECRKQGKFKQLGMVCFDLKSCVLADKNLNVNYMYFVLAPKFTAQPIPYFCFALPRTFLTAFLVLYLVIIHWLIFFIEIMFTACFC